MEQTCIDNTSEVYLVERKFVITNMNEIHIWFKMYKLYKLLISIFFRPFSF